MTILAPDVVRMHTIHELVECGRTATGTRVPSPQATAPSGAGKSTLAEVIAGLRAPTAGTVYVEGQVVRPASADSSSTAVALLTAAPFIFAGSVRHNLSYGLTQISESDLWEALREVGLATSIRARRDGLDSPLSSDTGTLSSGEARRLALARILLRSPTVSVLDEPTANLDPRSADIVRGLIRNRCIGSSILVITHDADVLRVADSVYRLQFGRVAPVASAPLRPGWSNGVDHERLTGEADVVGPPRGVSL